MKSVKIMHIRMKIASFRQNQFPFPQKGKIDVVSLGKFCYNGIIMKKYTF